MEAMAQGCCMGFDGLVNAKYTEWSWHSMSAIEVFTVIIITLIFLIASDYVVSNMKLLRFF